MRRAVSDREEACRRRWPFAVRMEGCLNCTEDTSGRFGLPTAQEVGISVAIVGAAGFLGRAMSNVFRLADVEVAAFTRASPALNAAGAAVAGLAHARTAFWLATSINPKIAETSPQSVAADYAAFSAFLEALSKLSNPPPVVLLSSGGTVYDDRNRPPYDESSPINPRSAYGKAKLALELQLQERAPSPSVVVRIANAYGPGQPVASGQGVVAHWLRAARRGEHLRIFGDPQSERDYVYVDDVAEAMLAVHRNVGSLPKVINIGTGVPTSLQALAEAVLEVVGNPSLRIEVEKARSFDVRRTWLDVSLAHAALGWRSRTSLHGGLTAAWSAVGRLGDPLQ